MNSFESNIRDIKKLVSILTGKDTEVITTYKGTSYGVTKPWNIKCESREINHENHETGAAELLNTLKIELQGKISFAEKQAEEYKKVLDAVGAPEIKPKRDIKGHYEKHS
jgi:hypothetical protein